MNPLTALLFALLLSGCGVQATWAPHVRAPSVVVADLGGRVVGTRAEGAYGSADVVVGVPREGTLSMRHALLGGGYRMLFNPLSLELGADLGVGEPVYRSWHGTGFYVGSSAALLLRLTGHQDAEIGYSPVGILADLVLQGRGGVWNPPSGDSHREIADASLQIGLRLTFISDLPVSMNRNWKQ